MNEESRESRPSERELKEALRSAVRPPVREVDWDRLHEAILADAEAHFRRRSPRTSDWVAAWAGRGIPAAVGALAAGIALLLLLPEAPGAREREASLPVAQELLADLPDRTRDLLSAGADVESMIRTMAAYNGGRTGS